MHKAFILFAYLSSRKVVRLNAANAKQPFCRQHPQPLCNLDYILNVNNTQVIHLDYRHGFSCGHDMSVIRETQFRK